MTGSDPTWSPSPTNPTENVALVSVAQGWGITEIQTMPAPLKVVHATDCSTTPESELPLNTKAAGNLVVTGSLMVGDTDVGAALGGGGSGLTWLEVTSDSTNHNSVECAVKDGIAYFRGTL